MNVAAGARLAERYVLLDPIGIGGIGAVWRAADVVLGREVAVKVLAGHLTDDPEFRVRLRREARTAARLDHPYITRVYDYGEIDEDGRPVQYLVMELLSGQTLSNRLKDGPLAIPDALSMAAQVAEALAAAHRRGVIHRDVTPGNIMLIPAVRSGDSIQVETSAIRVKVLDFGISTVAGDTAVTVAGQTLGTPPYLAPERFTGKPATPAVDVYALAAVLFHAVTGRQLYPGTWSDQAYAHLHASPALDDLPPGLRQLLGRCLAKDPSQRPGAEEMARTLRSLSPLEAARTAAIPPLAIPHPTQPSSGRHPPVAATGHRAAGRHQGTLVLPSTAYAPAKTPPGRRTASGGLGQAGALLAVVLLAVGGGLFIAELLRADRERPVPATQPATSAPPTAPTPSSRGPADPDNPEAALAELQAVVEDAFAAGDITPRAAFDIGRTLTTVVGLVERGKYENARERLDGLSARLEKQKEEGTIATPVYRDVANLIDYLHDLIPDKDHGDD